MPVVRESMSVSQLAELLGIEPWRFIAIETDLPKRMVKVVLEPAERDPATVHQPWKVQ